MRKKRRIDNTIRSAPSNRKGRPPAKKKVKKAKKAAKKAPKTKKVRVGAAPKTRNDGTMTESQFWGWIRQILRRKSMFWKPIASVRNAQRKDYDGPNKKRKYSYTCEGCGQDFDGQSVAVHHITPCGTLTKGEDLPEFVEKLFCEQEGLKLLCKKCHDKEHDKNK